jgi:hypothetical protein
VISAVGHVGLIGWLILGWGFSAEPLPFEAVKVSVVSGDEYAALVAATTPTPDTTQPEALTAPTEDPTPPAPEVETPAETPEPPAPVEPPADETPPPEAPAPPEPPTDVAEIAPQVPSAPAAAADLPVTSRPQERPADRIAATPTAPPPPDADTAAVVQDSAAPDQPAPEEVIEEPVEAAAPEETATQIAEEDAVPSGAVETSLRPSARPNRPAPAPQTAETDTTSATDDAVAAALANNNTASSANVPQGPPMTGSEREGFRGAVNACWNVDPGSVAARVTVEVGFSLDQNGRVTGDVRLISANGGDQAATNTAFQAARRAILRCQTQGGYDLPAEKYGQWKDVVITFDPSGMRLR